MANRTKRSVIWMLPSEEFKSLIKECKSRREVMKFWGLTVASGNYKVLNERIKAEGLDISHFVTNYSTMINSNKLQQKPLEEVMVENSTYCRSNLKSRLLKEGLLENKCQICKRDPIWEGNKLVLVLDHKNGKHDDHRLENLRLVCPNCNSQLDTFCGRHKHPKNHCGICGKVITKKSTYCKKCVPINSELSIKQRKVERPSKEELEHLIKTVPMTKIGKMFAVTDNTIRKWRKYYNIEFKGYRRGYWQKLNASIA